LTRDKKEDALILWEKYTAFEWYFRFTLIIYTIWFITKIVLLFSTIDSTELPGRQLGRPYYVYDEKLANTTYPVQFILFVWVFTFSLLIIILFLSLIRLFRFIEPSFGKRVRNIIFITLFTIVQLIFAFNLLGLFPIPSSFMTQASEVNSNPYCAYHFPQVPLAWINRFAY